MPVLIIDILNQDPLTIKIIPLNKKIHGNIMHKFAKNLNWRSMYLNYIVKEPKLSVREWGEVDIALLDRIMKSINFYINYIGETNQELRSLNSRIDVFTEELDVFVEYSKYHFDDYVDDRILELTDWIEKHKRVRDELVDKLDSIKEDRKTFEIKEGDLDV